MAKYCLINLAEMRGLLRDERGWEEADLPSAEEYVFDFTLNRFPQIIVRVYSSILRSSGLSRPVGGDAIRVCAVNTANDRGWVKTTRVHRVTGWRANLKSRVQEVLASAMSRAEYAHLPSPGALPLHAQDVRAGSILRLLTAAQEHLKYPKIRVEVDGVKLGFSVAGKNSKAPGTVNVTNGKPYESSKWYGRIDLQGVLYLRKPFGDDGALLSAVAKFAENPTAVAKLYGSKSGTCCFCRRELTTPESLTVGYGPVCADHFSLPWGQISDEHAPVLAAAIFKQEALVGEKW